MHTIAHYVYGSVKTKIRYGDKVSSEKYYGKKVAQIDVEKPTIID